MNLVTTSQEQHELKALTERLLGIDTQGKIVGILHIINDSLSDVVRSDETRIPVSYTHLDVYKRQAFAKLKKIPKA